MRKLLCCLLALGAAVICGPAAAQTVDDLTLNPKSIQSGHATEVTVVLDRQASGAGEVVELSSENPKVFIAPDRATIPAGKTFTRFFLRTFTIDAPASTKIKFTLRGATKTVELTVTAPPATPVRTRFATYSPSTQRWHLRGEDTIFTVLPFSNLNDVPVPADYLSTGRPQLAVFRPATAEWIIRKEDGSLIVHQFGAVGDLPVPGHYLDKGHAQIAVVRPSTAQWFIRKDDGTQMVVPSGFVSGDLPMPGDYDGQGKGLIAFFRSSTAQWFIEKTSGAIQHGQPGEVPVPADYVAQGRLQLATFRPSNATWTIRAPGATANTFTTLTAVFGQPGDRPVPGDYLGLGRTQLAVFRASTSEWLIRTDSGDTLRVPFGVPFASPNDIPIPAAYGRNFGQAGSSP